MGQLNPNISYIYENDGAHIYAREPGSLNRIIIGLDLNKIKKQATRELWNDVLIASETNESIQKALDQCIIIYKLSKEYEDKHGNSKT
jgi:hypothetical protein